MTDAEGAGAPFLQWRDGEGRQHTLMLAPEWARVTVGRSFRSDMPLAWDLEISRAHAVLEAAGADWTLVDDGLSRNGTFVNGNRVDGRQLLQDQDRLRFGKTEVLYRRPSAGGAPEAAAPPVEAPPLPPPVEPPAPPRVEPPEPRSAGATGASHLTGSQRRVLIALCRPMVQSGSAMPATNQEIAAEVSLSAHSVAAHMQDLTERFGLGHLPEDEKRTRLVAVVLRLGLLSPDDF